MLITLTEVIDMSTLDILKVTAYSQLQEFGQIKKKKTK